MDNILYNGISEDYTVPRIEKPIVVTEKTVKIEDKIYNIDNINNVYMERKEKSLLVKVLIFIFAVLGFILVATQVHYILSIILGISTTFGLVSLFIHKETNYLIYINNELFYQTRHLWPIWMETD